MKYLKNIFTTFFLVVFFIATVFIRAELNQIRAAAVVVGLTPNSFAELTATDVTVSYTTSATEFGIGDTITFIIAPTLPAALANCTSATVDADGDAANDGSLGSFTASGAIYTFTAATTTAATGGIDICIRFPATTTQGSYSIAITDSNDNDYGASLVYVGGDNDVTVTAIVGPTLSFNIRTLDDSADTNACDLGAVTTLTAPNLDGTDDGPGECGYGLAIGTNAENGVQAQITSNGALTNGVHNMTNVTNGGGFTAGTEAYGLCNITAAETGYAGGVFATPLTKNGDFATDATPIPTTPTNFVSHTSAVLYTAGSGATDTTRVMHCLAIASGTPTGSYSQQVTYTVTATF